MGIRLGGEGGGGEEIGLMGRMGLIFLGLVGLAVRCERSAVKVLLFLMVGAAGLPLAMPSCASRRW
jgi:hypothetical protein